MAVVKASPGYSNFAEVRDGVRAALDLLQLPRGFICPGDREAYAAAAGSWSKQLRYVEQVAPIGYGQALYCARQFVADEPFLHLVSDHLYLSREQRRCAQQLVEMAAAEKAATRLSGFLRDQFENAKTRNSAFQTLGNQCAACHKQFRN